MFFYCNMIQFYKFLHKRRKKFNRTVSVRLCPIFVLFSAGIGRTGVLITMETAMCLIECNQPVYPLDIVRTMRDQRAMMIQTPVSTTELMCKCIFSTSWFFVIRVCSKLYFSLFNSLPGGNNPSIGIGRYCPWAKPGPPLVFINTVLLETATAMYLHIIYGCFHITVAELKSCSRPPCDCRTKNVCYLVFCRKCLRGGWGGENVCQHYPHLLVFDCFNRCREATYPIFLSQMECWER